MNTQFITKPIRHAYKKHGRAVAGGTGLSAAAIMWLFHTFGLQSDVMALEHSNARLKDEIHRVEIALALHGVSVDSPKENDNQSKP